MTYVWFDVTCNAGIARIMHMSYRSKTYTWNDVILVKRSMILLLFSFIVKHQPMVEVLEANNPSPRAVDLSPLVFAARL